MGGLPLEVVGAALDAMTMSEAPALGEFSHVLIIVEWTCSSICIGCLFSSFLLLLSSSSKEAVDTR